MVNPRVFFDVTVDSKPLGRVIFELFADKAPKTCENFRALCTGEKGLSHLSEYPLYYKNSILHRCIKDFMIQGGDFTKRNGTGGESIYGGTFPDEDLSQPIDSEGLLCMANKGPNTNGSQFFITLRACPHLNGKHVVFGKVIRGYEEVVKAIEKVPVDQKDRPSVPVVIANCGELVLKAKAAPKQESAKEDKQASVSGSEASESDDEDHKHKKRRHRHSKNRDDSADEDEGEDDRKRRKKSKHKHRSRSEKVNERDGSTDKKDKNEKEIEPEEETEEQYDARLEREEKERIEQARKKELERLKEQTTVVSSSGVRFKGRGRMKFMDPELRRDQPKDYRY